MSIWTSLADEADVLIPALEGTGRVAVDQIGTSAGGLPVRLYRIGGDTSGPPPSDGRAVLLFVGLQHGNEPAGREALLAFAEHLSTTSVTAEEEFLDEHGVYMIPTANPDGFPGTRANGAGQDINRFHLTLDAPETLAIATVMTAQRPLLAVDMHEFGPGFRPEDVLFGRARHAATAGGVVSSSETVVSAMRDRAAADGLSFADYPDSGAGESLAQRYVANAGLRHSSAVLLETRRTVDDDPGQQARVDIQYAMAEEALEYCIDNADLLLSVAGEAASGKAAEGAAGTTPFELGGGVTIDPPPLAYDLTGPQLAQTATHRSLFSIATNGDGRVSMGQPSQPVIPLLLDQDAEFALVTAARVFESPSSPGGLPQVATAQLKAVMSWLACDLASGVVLGTLPDVVVDEVSRVIGDYTSSQVKLPIPSVGGRDLTLSERAALAMARTHPDRTMLAAIVNDIPLWAGIPRREEWGTPATVPLGYVSVDGYLRHRYVRNHDFVDADLSVIAANLFGDANASIDGLGTGIGLIIDAQPTGVQESRQYRFNDHRTVYDALTKLMMIQNGPEWTVDIDWVAGQVGRVIALIARIAPRLGQAATTPQAVFSADVFSSTGAASAEYAELLDYSDGRHANVVYAYSSGQGEDQPVSAPAIDTAQLATGAPIWERHYQPEQDIRDVPVLTRHAAAELVRVRAGHRALSVSAVWNAYPRYGLDWQLGDDVGAKLRGHAHPDRLTGVRRAIGFRLQPAAGRMLPILQEDL